MLTPNASLIADDNFLWHSIQENDTENNPSLLNHNGMEMKDESQKLKESI